MMLNATIRFANCVGLKGGSARFVILNVSSDAVLTRRNPQDSAMNAKIAAKRFDDLTGTIFAGHHQPLKNLDSLFVLYRPQPVE